MANINFKHWNEAIIQGCFALVCRTDSGNHCLWQTVTLNFRPQFFDSTILNISMPKILSKLISQTRQHTLTYVRHWANQFLIYFPFLNDSSASILYPKAIVSWLCLAQSIVQILLTCNRKKFTPWMNLMIYNHIRL